jgi:hypothetical protein
MASVSGAQLHPEELWKKMKGGGNGYFFCGSFGNCENVKEVRIIKYCCDLAF